MNFLNVAALQTN